MATLSPCTYVIVGGGVSGLTLAHLLADALGPDQRLLLVDKDDDPDYNISFWSPRPTPFAPVMRHTWRKIAVRHGDRQTVCALERYALQAFWRDEFDAHLHNELRQHSRVALLDAAVTNVVDCGDHVEVQTTTGAVRADWVFDSRSSVAAVRAADPSLLVMHGLAVEVECEQPVFDPSVATLFDFLLDSPQFDFMYVLPYTEHTALVNVAYVTPYATAVSRDHCEQAIARYITDRLGCRRYAVGKACFGRIPLASRFVRRTPRSRIVPIGVRAGMIKASTSYAFTRILDDAERTVAALTATGRPYYRPHRSWYYRATDKSTARVFVRAPKLAQELMFALFTPDNGDLALSFLDEVNSLPENRRLFTAIPPATVRRFLWELVRLPVGG